MADKFRMPLGRAGESYAAQLVANAGYEILERNWRGGRRGELDLIATKDSNLVVIEVRTRIGTRFGTALESIDPRKVTRLRGLAAAWAKEAKLPGRLRIDVIALTLPLQQRQALIDACENENTTIDLGGFCPEVEWVEAIA